MPRSTPIKCHGGKAYLAQWIISHFPEHTHYVEPYFGGGSVLLQKPDRWVKGHSEVINDLNQHLTRFWLVISSKQPAQRFVDKLSRTPFSQTLFRQCQIALQQNKFRGWLDAAFAFFVVNRQSRQGLGQSFATLSKTRTRGGMNEQVHAWQSVIESLRDGSLTERLRRVVVLNMPALDVIRAEDSPKTLFYLDPPYLPESRAHTTSYGAYEMSEEDHVELLTHLAFIDGKFLLSGYPSDLYSRVVKAEGWRCHTKQIDNKASGKATKRIMTECLWTNF